MFDRFLIALRMKRRGEVPGNIVSWGIAVVILLIIVIVVLKLLDRI